MSSINFGAAVFEWLSVIVFSVAECLRSISPECKAIGHALLRGSKGQFSGIMPSFEFVS